MIFVSVLFSCSKNHGNSAHFVFKNSHSPRNNQFFLIILRDTDTFILNEYISMYSFDRLEVKGIIFMGLSEFLFTYITENNPINNLNLCNFIIVLLQ